VTRKDVEKRRGKAPSWVRVISLLRKRGVHTFENKKRSARKVCGGLAPVKNLLRRRRGDYLRGRRPGRFRGHFKAENKKQNMKNRGRCSSEIKKEMSWARAQLYEKISLYWGYRAGFVNSGNEKRGGERRKKRNLQGED